MDQSKIVGLVIVAFLFVASYGYVTTEAQDVSDADPTHNGKAFLAEYLPFFWVIFILLFVAVILGEIADDLT